MFVTSIRGLSLTLAATMTSPSLLLSPSRPLSRPRPRVTTTTRGEQLRSYSCVTLIIFQLRRRRARAGARAD